MRADLIDQPTKRPARKVVAATTGATAGTMAAIIIGGLLSRFVGPPFDDPYVMSGWPVIGGSIGAYLSGYYARERAHDGA